MKSPLERIQWLSTLQADRNVSPAALRVAIALVSRVNGETGQLNPTLITLAKDVGMSDRSVERAVSELQELRYISVTKAGRYNHYVLVIPDRTDGSTPDKTDGYSMQHPSELTLTPDRTVADTRQNCRIEQGKNKVMNKKDGAPSATKVGKPPSCPHQEIVRIYHKTLPMLPGIKIWNDKRERLLRTRWKEDPERQSPDWWEQFFMYVAESDFLTGQTEGKGDRPSFRADLEWLIRPSNFAKVIEGKYHNHGGAE